MLNYREELEHQGLSYSDSKLVLPIQRFFHRSHIHDFKVTNFEDYLKVLRNP